MSENESEFELMMRAQHRMCGYDYLADDDPSRDPFERVTCGLERAGDAPYCMKHILSAIECAMKMRSSAYDHIVSLDKKIAELRLHYETEADRKKQVG